MNDKWLKFYYWKVNLMRYLKTCGGNIHMKKESYEIIYKETF